MPEFIPQHTPRNLDDFTRGYLDAAEWLLDEETDRDSIEGQSEQALTQAKEECEAFQRDNADDLALYEEKTGRDMECTGHDYWLTRNRHGAGYWDRGDHPCLKRLTDAAHANGSADVYTGDDGRLYFF